MEEKKYQIVTLLVEYDPIENEPVDWNWGTMTESSIRVLSGADRIDKELVRTFANYTI